MDQRTYQVSFGRVREMLPQFHCERTVQNSIPALLESFRQIPLTMEQFKDINYYRLQKLESLFNAGALTSDLYWKD